MTARIARCGAANHCRFAALAAIVLASSGCVAMRPVTISPPPVQLLEAAELALPVHCAAVPGTVYRTLFEVQPDGRVSAPRSEAGDGCVQEALRDWVMTFSYAPLAAPTPVAFDWMAVTASRSR